MFCILGIRTCYIIKIIIPNEKLKILKLKQDRINTNLISIRIVPNPTEEEKDLPITCPICYDIMDDNIMKLTNCNHMYHQDCIMKWIERTYPIISCPICRNGDS